MTRSLRDPWLVGALVVGFLLRLYGIDHGLPHVYNPDEANIMARSLAVAQSLDPGYYLYPSLLFYVLFGLMGGLFTLGRLFGRYEDLAAFQRLFFDNPTDFYVVGRLLGVATGVATIAATYVLAAKHFGRPVARVAAGLMAISYHHVRDAHYIKHDVPAGLVLIAVLIALDRVMEEPRRGRLLLLGSLVGVGFALHYYMIFLAPLVVAAHVAAHGRQSLQRSLDLVLVGAVASSVFFLLSPYVVLHFPTALDHMSANRQVVVDRSLDAGALFPSWPSYLRFMLRQAYGYGWCLLMLVGVGVLLRRDPRRAALWLGFVVPFAMFIGYTFFAGRYLNPIVAPLCVAAALGLGAIARHVGWKWAGALALIASVQPLLASYHVDRLFAAPDTRSIARDWVLSSIDDGTGLALQSYSVPVPRRADDMRRALEANGAEGELSRRGKFTLLIETAESAEGHRPSYPVVFLGAGDEKNRRYVSYDALAESLAPLEQSGVDVLILKHPPAEMSPPLQALFERATTSATLVHRVSPFVDSEAAGLNPYLDNEDWPVHRGLGNKGPEIEIYRLEGSAESR